MSEQPSTFFYAKDGQRLGPLPIEQLASLVQAGDITEASLVWNEALTEWKPYAEYVKIVERGYARCAVSNALRPISEMVQFGEQYVSAEHRDEFFQRVKEGVASAGKVVTDPVELDRLLTEEGFHTSAGSIISRSWNLWKNHFGIVVGVVLVSALLGGIAGQIPIIGLLATILLQPHLGAGCQMVLARKVRGQEVAFEALFEPLKLYYGRLVLFGLINIAIGVLLFAIVGGATLFAIGTDALMNGDFESFGSSPASIAIVIVAVLVAMMLGAVAFLRLSFAPILIADKGLELGTAMRLSWRAGGMRFWPILGSFIVLCLMASLGLVALFIGILLTMGFPYIGISVAYDDAFGSRGASE